MARRVKDIPAHEIRNLQQLNAQMAQEALNLTKALKGITKLRATGEVVLTRVLEASGLREGYEYQTQVSIETDNRSRMQPDVIVRLPQGRGDRRQNDRSPMSAISTPKTTTPAKSRCRNTLPRCETIFACWDARIINSCPACARSTMC